MENIKRKLIGSIRANGEYFFMNEPLNDELIYQIIFDTYFKDLTVEDIKEFVNISYPSKDFRFNIDTRVASFNLKLIANFTFEDRMNKLNDSLNPY